MCIQLVVPFQWDPRKSGANQRKHKIAFGDAVGVFEDPRAITIDDSHPTEERYVTIGLDLLGRVLVVSWTPRGDRIRLISARRSTQRERVAYEGND
jgi:uncharacterized DUF497 family protein